MIQKRRIVLKIALRVQSAKIIILLMFPIYTVIIVIELQYEIKSKMTETVIALLVYHNPFSPRVFSIRIPSELRRKSKTVLLNAATRNNLLPVTIPQVYSSGVR